MFVTKINILQDVLAIIKMDTKVRKLFLDQCIYYLRNSIHTNHDTHQPLVDNPHYKFFLVDIDKIFILQKFHYTVLP